jgi:hypothetical protein
MPPMSLFAAEDLGTLGPSSRCRMRAPAGFAGHFNEELGGTIGNLARATVTVSSRPSACSASADDVEQHLAAPFHMGHGVLYGR